MKASTIALTTAVAEKFLRNYNAIRDPQSFSYNDNYCGAAISEKVREYGFKSADVMAEACRKLLKISKPRTLFEMSKNKKPTPKTAKPKKELTYGVAKTFVDNYRGINDPTAMSYCDGHAISWLEDQAKKYGFGDRISTMNAACRIFLRNNKPAKKGSKKLAIEIVKYMGKFGSFANHESEMYRADLVGVNGKRQTLPDTRACCTEYEGNPERKYADQVAKIWAALLGCEIVFVDKTAIAVLKSKSA